MTLLLNCWETTGSFCVRSACGNFGLCGATGSAEHNFFPLDLPACIHYFVFRSGVPQSCRQPNIAREPFATGLLSGPAKGWLAENSLPRPQAHIYIVVNSKRRRRCPRVTFVGTLIPDCNAEDLLAHAAERTLRKCRSFG